MSHDDDPPELAGYEPGEGKPLRHPMTIRVMRVVIVLGIVGLVAPGLYATVALQSRTAAAVCEWATDTATNGAEAVARFELLGPGGPSWYCYARDFGGREVLLGSLGLIPGFQLTGPETSLTATRLSSGGSVSLPGE